MFRTPLLPLAFVAAIALPYFTSHSTSLREWADRKANVKESGAAQDVAHEKALAGIDSAEHNQQELASAKKMAHPEGPPVADLSEVFRLDATTAWVLSRWPRVTTRLAPLDLQGYRVPLVTGTKDSDLAGSLTYYFNRDQRVQRITFIGTTGDSRPLVALMATKFGFTRQLVRDAGLYLYQVKEGKQAVSELRIKPAATVSAADPNGRFQVALVIERPKTMQ